MLRDRLHMSERRACRIAGQNRSTQRHHGPRLDRDDALRRRLREISREHPRWGYRKAWALLRTDGWEVNRKRIQRLWREEGLRVPPRRRKRRRLGQSTTNAARLRAEHPNHVWALGPVVSVLSEFQIVDRDTEVANELGDGSHTAYKNRQKEAVMRRLKLGTRATRKSDAPPRSRRR